MTVKRDVSTRAIVNLASAVIAEAMSLDRYSRGVLFALLRGLSSGKNTTWSSWQVSKVLLAKARCPVCIGSNVPG